jgi:hypothetical protein
VTNPASLISGPKTAEASNLWKKPHMKDTASARSGRAAGLSSSEEVDGA